MNEEIRFLLRDVQLELVRLNGNYQLRTRIENALGQPCYGPVDRALDVKHAKTGTPAPGPRSCNECTHPNSCEILEICMFQK